MNLSLKYVLACTECGQSLPNDEEKAEINLFGSANACPKCGQPLGCKYNHNKDETDGNEDVLDYQE